MGFLQNKSKFHIQEGLLKVRALVSGVKPLSGRLSACFYALICWCMSRSFIGNKGVAGFNSESLLETPG